MYMYMTYTDQDILDLYTCLQGVGLAETPYEEAERLRTEARADYKRSLDPQLDMTKWILAKGYSHTYALIVRQNSLTKLMTTALFPVVRGHVLCSSGVYSLEEFEAGFSSKVISFHYYLDLHSLKQGILTIGKIHPTITPDKYPFLDIVC
jgi:hypothetical protein